MGELLPLFFDGWGPLLRILIVGTLSYLSLMFMLRLSGARTLARMNPFDFAITVALGSTYGRLLTAEDVTLAEAVVAFALLVGLQVLFSFLTTRVPGLARVLSPQPALLFYRGDFLHRNMRRERITEADLRTAVREHGLGSIEEVEAIAVETSGRLTVVGQTQVGSGSALRELKKEVGVERIRGGRSGP
jgi:uncharacterized membrane protein YcaP (DUF421 family)